MSKEICYLKQHIKLEFTSSGGLAQLQSSWPDETIRECPSCGGLRYIETVDDRGYRRMRPCVGELMLGRIEKFNKARIPARFKAATFDNFRLDKIRDNSSITQFISKIKRFKFGERGSLLEGGPGTGKTHLLCAAIRYLTLESNIDCRYVDYSQLLSEIRAAYAQNVSDSTLILPLTSIPVLFLDELGKGRDKANDFEIRIIDQIINDRYLNPRLVTMFASNYRDRFTSGYNKFIMNGYGDASKIKMWNDFAKDERKALGFSDITSFENYVRYILSLEHVEDRISERTASRIKEMSNQIGRAHV